MFGLPMLVMVSGLLWNGGTYLDPRGAFTINVPAGYTMRVGPEKGSNSYIPLCHAYSSVCFEYPTSRFPGTNFESASVEVTVLLEKTPKSCLDRARAEILNQATGRQSGTSLISKQVIDSVGFLSTDGGDAAMSHDVDYREYFGFDAGGCFKIVTSMSCTNFTVYERGQINRFTRKNHAQVMAELKAILRTFRAVR